MKARFDKKQCKLRKKAMKEIKELKFEELSVEQKLGMSCVFLCAPWAKPDDIDYVEDLIRKHSVGAIWIPPQFEGRAEILKRLLGAADYPLLSFTDAEAGIGEHLIGRHNTLACCDSRELAYTFGKVTAITARKMGYNVVCNPVIDMNRRNAVCGTVIRSLGHDKEKVTELAAAIAEGAHDGGVLTVAKHYPGKTKNGHIIDSHMAETASDETKEELLDYNLYPYIELNKRGLIDGVMLGHARFSEIDPDYPFSLSAKGIQILRDEGFDGFAVTDALGMLGVVAKFGKFGSIALAIGNAGALALPFTPENEAIMENLKAAYNEGKIPDEVLDASVKRVLAAQHKVFEMQPKYDTVTEEDEASFKRINYDAVIARADEGLSHTVSRDGRHCFVILTATDLDLRDTSKVTEDTMKTEWYDPYRIKTRLEELFPNSFVTSINEYPTPSQNRCVLREIAGYDSLEPYEDVIFITFYQSQTYIGKECFTSRIIALFEALDVTKSISALVHFGNPFLAEDLPHLPRIILGPASRQGVEAGLDVLAGEYPANGKLIYDVKFK